MGRVGQVLGIVCFGLIFYMIIDKAVNDISTIIYKNPGDFWPSFIRYILVNLMG